MVEDIAGKVAVSTLNTHIRKWIANLTRAGDARQQQSRDCLKKVVLCVRKTAVYCRALNQGQAVDYGREAEIAMDWTELGIELEQLGLKKLAKKCRVKGWYWEDQTRFDEDFLREAQVSFDQIESLATCLLTEISS